MSVLYVPEIFPDYKEFRVVEGVCLGLQLF